MNVLLGVLPFGDLAGPALGPSLLAAGARQAGHTVQVRYFNLIFARWIGASLYQAVAHGFASGSSVGDWFFAPALFGDAIPSAEAFSAFLLDTYGRIQDPVADRRRYGGRTFTGHLRRVLLPALRDARPRAVPFVTEAAAEILRQKPDVVGFSVGLHQSTASLAVARRVKEAAPSVRIVLGGASCQGTMGRALLRCFTFVDAVCTGEGDTVFPAWLDGRSVDGILERGDGPGVVPRVHDLDALPSPDFDDWFREREALGAPVAPGTSVIPLETSRGCWWGARRSCGFCGNHPALQPFRARSSPRVLEELDRVRARHTPGLVLLSDDILDPASFEGLFPEMARQGGIRFSCESKANLRRAQLQTLKDAGAAWVQVGIESLDDRVLEGIPKGITSLRCLQVLRECVEVGLEVRWNLLHGLPHEPVGASDALARRLRAWTHLPPPMGPVPMALKRFSPFFQDPERYGLVDVRPSDALGFAWDLPPSDLADLAYYFDFSYADGRDPQARSRRLRRAVGRWQRAWQGERPRLDLTNAGAWDSRGPRPRLHTLTPDERRILDATARVRPVAEVVTGSAGERALRRLERLRLVARDPSHVVRLVVSAKV